MGHSACKLHARFLAPRKKALRSEGRHLEGSESRVRPALQVGTFRLRRSRAALAPPPLNMAKRTELSRKSHRLSGQAMGRREIQIPP